MGNVWNKLLPLLIALAVWLLICWETVATGRFAFFLPGAILGLVIYGLVMWVVVGLYKYVFTAIKRRSHIATIVFACAFAAALAWGLIVGLGLYTTHPYQYQGHLTQLHLLGAITALIGSGSIVFAASDFKRVSK